MRKYIPYIHTLWIIITYKETQVGLVSDHHSCCKMPPGDRWRAGVRAEASNMHSSTGKPITKYAAN